MTPSRSVTPPPTSEAGDDELSRKLLFFGLTVGHQVTVILLGRPKDQDVVQSETFVLECFLTGLPAPTVTWTKQGVSVVSHCSIIMMIIIIYLNNYMYNIIAT